MDPWAPYVWKQAKTFVAKWGHQSAQPIESTINIQRTSQLLTQNLNTDSHLVQHVRTLTKRSLKRAGEAEDLVSEGLG